MRIKSSVRSIETEQKEKMMKLKPFNQQFDPLNKNRQLGSVEWLETTDGGSIFLDKKHSTYVSTELQKLGYQTKIIPNMNNEYTVIYYKQINPEIQIAIDLYTTYENTEGSGDGKVQGLTREEHMFLGRMFGFSKGEIKEFILDLKDDFDS